MTGAFLPPRFVPTLTEVVYPAKPLGAPHVAELEPSHLQSSHQTQRLEEQLLQRVMQRVDLVLERRLREAVGQLILVQTQTLTQCLRTEVELVVRESVSQAIAQELLLPQHTVRSK